MPPTSTRRQNEPSAGDARTGAVLLELARLATPILIGLAIAIGIQHWIVLPKLGYPAEVRRPIAMAKSLKAGLFEQDQSASIAVIISNSAGVEGVDAQVVQQAAPPGWQVYNFSSNGTNQIETRMLADALAEAGADLVIWLMRPDMLETPRAMHADVTHAWAKGGFAQGRDWLGPPWVDSQTLETLASGPWETSVHFRRRWLDALNYKMRRQMRQGIRTPAPDDWNAPFNLEIELDGPRLDRHLNEISSEMTSAMETFDEIGEGSGRQFITDMADDFAQRPATLGIIIAPTHPALEAQFTPIEQSVQAFLDPLAHRTGMLVGNAGGLLEADKYADAIHPDVTGRETLSQWIGQWLPSPESLIKKPTEGR
ncbi:MAG: hypothetical protein MK101_11575 [Phycisphaerales bacterium]|nr:hypothetical protein [Phycisphaerales bacterium]